MVLEEAGGGSFYRRASGVDRAPPATPGHCARRRVALVRGGEGDATHAGTVGERRRAQDQEEGDEHSAERTMALAGPRPCSLRRPPASASARGS